MERIEFDYPAKRKISGRAHVGVVGSGDLEVLLEPTDGNSSHVSSGPAWTVFARPGKRCWTGSSRNTTVRSAFKSTMLGRRRAAFSASGAGRGGE